MPAAVDSAVSGLTLAGALQPRRPWGRWGQGAALLGCGVVGGDLLLQLGHGLGHTALNLTLAGAAVLWLRRRSRGNLGRLAPTSAAGWLERCDTLLAQFEQLQPATAEADSTALLDQQQRQQQLQQLRTTLGAAALQLAVAGTELPAASCQSAIVTALSTRQALHLHWGETLGAGINGWNWPLGLARCDLVLYSLSLPLSAADLRWLEARPASQEAWVLARSPVLADPSDGELLRRELAQQLQQIPEARLLLWNGETEDLGRCLEPFSQALHTDGPALKQSARRRQAETLHQQWLMQLEQLRRQRWRQLVQRTQWLVAAGVLAAPATSLDLVVLTAANGLMLKDMAKLWNCNWELEQLQAAAAELGQAALTLGVLEWSNQALANLLRLHGASWLLGGALQALSAAYLTRVVGRAMADTLALAAGLSEPNLALIKAQAPQLVLQAAEAEKIDWAGFLEQGRQWLLQQQAAANGEDAAARA